MYTLSLDIAAAVLVFCTVLLCNTVANCGSCYLLHQFCPSVTRVDWFSPPSSFVIVIFSYWTLWQNSGGLSPQQVR